MLNTTELKANGRKLGSCRKVSKHANCLLKSYKGQNENLQHLETSYPSWMGTTVQPEGGLKFRKVY